MAFLLLSMTLIQNPTFPALALPFIVLALPPISAFLTSPGLLSLWQCDFIRFNGELSFPGVSNATRFSTDPSYYPLANPNTGFTGDSQSASTFFIVRDLQSNKMN